MRRRESVHLAHIFNALYYDGLAAIDGRMRKNAVDERAALLLPDFVAQALEIRSCRGLTVVTPDPFQSNPVETLTCW